MRVRDDDEIGYILTGVGNGMFSSGRAHSENYEYERGAYDMLQSVTLACGLAWDEVIAQIREAHNGKLEH